MQDPQSEVKHGVVEDEWRVTVVSAPDPPGEQWSLVIGDCVQNFRCSLDHMILQLTDPQTRADHPTRPEFPIYSDSRLYRREAARRIATVPAAARRIIEAAQPFQRGACATEDPLALFTSCQTSTNIGAFT